MRDELVQRNGLIRRRFTLVADGIRVTEWSLTQGRTVVVPYEVVYGDEFEKWSSSLRALISTIVMAMLALATGLGGDTDRFAWLFWGIGAVVSGAYYWMTRRVDVGYVDAGARIVFFRDRPNADAFTQFLDKIERRARERVRARIIPLQRSQNSGADRIRAALLLSREIISEAEHAAFLRELVVGEAPEKSEQLQN